MGSLIEWRGRLRQIACRLEIWRDEHGQDLIEYALMAGFVATMAGAVMPDVSATFSTILSKVSRMLSKAATTGSKG